MIRGIKITASDTAPMPPEEVDFSITIDFEKGTSNPKRIFDAASAIIEGLERFDRAAAISIDAGIDPVMVLEDVERGSLKILLRNLLKSVDDDALKDLEWKKQVGKYLVRAKYIALEWLDEDRADVKISDLREGLQKIASETDVRYLPDYSFADGDKLVSALEKIQDAKRILRPSEKIIFETDEMSYSLNTSSTWSPTEVSGEETTTRDSYGRAERIYTIRKPDYLGNTMWQFRHGKASVSAPVLDEEWIGRFRSGNVVIKPGDAIRCEIKEIYTYDKNGELIDQKIEIVRVLEVIPGWSQQELFD